MFDTGVADTVRNEIPSDPRAVRKNASLFANVASATSARFAANNNRANARKTPSRRI